MADAEILPFDFRTLQATIGRYAMELVELVKTTRENTTIENQLIKANDYTLAADPTKKFIAPEAKSDVPEIDFKPLTSALDSLKKSADKLADKQSADMLKDGKHDKLNKLFYQAEQQLLSTDGLPRRGWYKHTIYAPGFYTGYGVKTLPGIREAIEQRNWTEAQAQISVVAGRINALAAYLNSPID
jgi:N-acetylated-alpha-linked acidic dipeptidase